MTEATQHGIPIKNNEMRYCTKPWDLCI